MTTRFLVTSLTQKNLLPESGCAELLLLGKFWRSRWSPGNPQFSNTPLDLSLALLPLQEVPFDPVTCGRHPRGLFKEPCLRISVSCPVNLRPLGSLVKRSSRHTSRIPIVVSKLRNTSANAIFQSFCHDGVTHKKRMLQRSTSEAAAQHMNKFRQTKQVFDAFTFLVSYFLNSPMLFWNLCLFE